MPNTSPHVVKFSGGRSSGMMLLKLLRQRKLSAKRGDVIVFNNTSAEHSATYEFVKEIKKMAEAKYNIPFFWVEFQTYEGASNGHWTRKPTYRLVNEKPYSAKNKQGYRYKGEIFEEMLSFNGYFPSAFNRTCTIMMKIFPTNAFLTDWFAQKEEIEWQGHFYECSQMTDDQKVITNHKKNRGTTPDKILLKKKAYMRQCPYNRPEQRWEDYTSASLCIKNPELRESVIGDKAQLYGDDAIDYVSCLGIRKDEQMRIGKIKMRIEQAQASASKSLHDQPWGEIIKAPLIENSISKEDVIKFWEKQPFNLNLPNSGLYSNCVYCPLKGKAKLTAIAQNERGKKFKAKTGTPESIKWWKGIEEKYSRDLIAEKRKVTSTSNKKIKYISCWGASDSLVYETIEKQAQSKAEIDADFQHDISLPCNCTD